MKRTLSGELAPTPSPTHSPDGQPAGLNQHPQQQQTAANDGAPTMYTPNANDPVLENPLFGVEAEEDLPDWEEFAQMLPHTPPVENRRDAQDDENLSSSEDEVSGSGLSSDDSNASIFDEDTIVSIRDGIHAGNDTVTIRNLGIREVKEILQLCKQDARITCLHIKPTQYLPDSRQATLTELLTGFFEECHSVRSLEFHGYTGGPVRIEANLLSAVFRNTGIAHLSLNYCTVPPSSPTESESLIQSIKQNTSLKFLRLESIHVENPDLQIADALAGNSSLEGLQLGIREQRDICQSLADHLKSNRQLKTLDLGLHASLAPADLGKVFAAVKDHPALECLNAQNVYFITSLEGNLIWQLVGNRNLKVLLLPKAFEMTADAVEALIELVQYHPTLTHLHLGSVPQQHQLRMKLACGLKSNTRLISIGINFSNFYQTYTETESLRLQMIKFATEIGNIPTLRSVEFELFSDLDCLFEFLKSCPQIRAVALRDWLIKSKDQREKLLSIVKQSGQITHFPAQGKTDSVDDKILQFTKELRQALLLNQQIELNINAASEAMKKILDQKSMMDESLPFVPLDVTNELTKAIARHVPPEKAKAIFDELIIHAPGHQKTM